jgi:hypothetical protein
MVPWSHGDGTNTIQASSGAMEPRKSVLSVMVMVRGERVSLTFKSLQNLFCENLMFDARAARKKLTMKSDSEAEQMV